MPSNPPRPHPERMRCASDFPSADRDAGLLAAFAVFSTAFIFRPVGALPFGRRGDRSGRRQVLVLMIIVMSLATAGVGMLPGYASIGLLAPVLLILLRVAQGLSAGGEAGAASAFVVEYAPVHRRGWYGGWIWATLALGLAAATGTATLLAWLLPQATLEAWAWRLAFLAALPVGVVGLYLRLRLDETPRFRAVQRADTVAEWPVREALRAYPRQMLVGLALVAAASLTFNTSFIYLPNHLAADRGVPLSRALAGALLGPTRVSLQRPGDHLWAGQRVVRGYGTTCGHAPGTAHWQPAPSRVLRHHRRPPGSHRDPADRGDRIPAAGCRRDPYGGTTRWTPWNRLSEDRP
jgi:MFS family permease